MLCSLAIQGEVLSSRICGFLFLFCLTIELDLLELVTSVLLLSKLRSGAGLGCSLAADCLHGVHEALGVTPDAGKNDQKQNIRATFTLHANYSTELKDEEGCHRSQCFLTFILALRSIDMRKDELAVAILAPF